jgi:hypothetical protein
MAFLDDYCDTRRVPVGAPDRGYWVELRTTLLQGDKAAAERALISGRIRPGDGAEMNMDHVAYREKMLLASIVAWNLDDPDGTVWPVTLESVRRLPSLEFDRLAKLVDEMNAPPSKEETRQFPDERSGGDPHGERRPAITGQVLARDGAVEAPRAAPGGSGEPTVA